MHVSVASTCAFRLGTRTVRAGAIARVRTTFPWPASDAMVAASRVYARVLLCPCHVGDGCCVYVRPRMPCHLCFALRRGAADARAVCVCASLITRIHSCCESRLCACLLHIWYARVVGAAAVTFQYALTCNAVCIPHPSWRLRTRRGDACSRSSVLRVWAGLHSCTRPSHPVPVGVLLRMRASDFTLSWQLNSPLRVLPWLWRVVRQLPCRWLAAAMQPVGVAACGRDAVPSGSPCLRLPAFLPQL